MTYRARPDHGVAWITGASSGIGRAAALELARRGFTVAATARRVGELESLVAEALLGPGRVVAHPGDVTDEAGTEALVSVIERLHGPIALAVLNAGVSPRSERQPLDPAAVRQAFEVNLLGVANGLAAVISRMEERGRGQIAVNGSVAGYRGLPQAPAYGASKAAVIYLCESLRHDCERRGLTLQLVNPGFVDTPMTRGNRFPMPFLVPLDEAARRLCDGLERGGFEVAFPRRLAFLMKALRLLPHAAYGPLMSRAMGGRRGKDRAR